MNDPSKDYFAKLEKACGPLLFELQAIWDEIGESGSERDGTYDELAQECLEAHRRKLDKASRFRAQLRQAIADMEAELATICSAMAERPDQTRQANQSVGGLKSELSVIIPQVEEMRKRKAERMSQFLDIIEQIRKISLEIGFSDCDSSKIMFDESELSVRKLEELHKELQSLQKEKSERLKKVMMQLKTLNSLCLILGLDFEETVREVHPSLDQESEGSKNISNETIERLESSIQSLKEIKIQRMHKIQDLATTMLELWDLMDTPIEEQQMFQNVTCTVAALEHEITEPNILSLHFLNEVESEVLRLQQIKASKMTEFILKKKAELEEIRRKTHLVPEDCDTDFAIEAVEAGAIDPSLVLEQIEEQISLIKEESFSRKDILERVEKWLAACEEESWLEEYNRDENRYNAGRGAHLSLKRAEKARALANKIPAMLENLSAKIKTWERERGKDFTYDGESVLSMLEQYTVCRLEKEQELKRQREQKKLQGQLITEQESLYGSKPSPSKPTSAKKGSRPSTGGFQSRRFSLGGAMMMGQSARPETLNRSNSSTYSTKKPDHLRSTLSPGRRGTNNPGLPTKKLHFNNSTRQAETPHHQPETPRQPFSQLSLHHHNLTTPSKPRTILPVPSRTPMQVAATPAGKSESRMILPVSSRTPVQVAATPAGKSESRTILPVSSRTPMQVANTPAGKPVTRTILPVSSRTPMQVANTPAGKPVTRTILPVSSITPILVPMQVAQTPAGTLSPKKILQRNEVVVKALEMVEYSFEERRLKCYLAA
ncbi:hypothetical protein LUZ60_001093 [Juncus effusus]|nr:hypothetical protein LUZ60_001093 [Juncus effusus]